MPITLHYPTQAELAQFQQGGLLADMNRIAQQQKTNVPGVAPGGAATSPTIPTPVPTPKPVATPQINYTPQNNEEWIKATTDMINQLNQQAQQAANAGRIPGGAGLEAKSSANIGSALAGNVPNDVYTQMAQRSAERGVASGSPMGANSTADIMRALGLTSLDMQNTGQNWLNSATARNPAAPIFDPSKLLITPTQATGFGLDQANFDLSQQKYQSDIANANAQRQLQSDLANADTQFKRDQLIWQFQQNQLDRDNALRLAQLKASQAAGYGRGAGGGGSSNGQGGFNPATNWAGGTGITPDAWSQGITKDQYWGSTKGSDFTPGTYTDTMNPLYGYTQTPGLPNTVPGGSPWEPQPFDTGGLDDILGGGNSQSYNDLTEDEWYSLYGG